ncbi:hypothetical protein Bca52824_069192 [Brassica carinata]|uniref:Vesicle transport v-SNARE N-terminal domain-containing protein n=1 Tax=Brassica carinata TaxID=52824 RepID=A0A8X7Q580_BRACI|nr:hypothetical protein Bca52824_069192 [Brassica carinata]
MYSFPRRYGRVGHFRTRVGSVRRPSSGFFYLEARSLQPSANAGCISKLREYKSDLNQLKKDFKRVSSPDANQSTRGELMDPGMADVHACSCSSFLSKSILDARDVTLLLSFNVPVDQSGIFAMSMERLDQSSDIMRESRRLMLEKEEVGISVVENLTAGSGNAINKSKKVLTAMSKRRTRNKWIIGLVIVALILAIILIITYKVSHYNTQNIYIHSDCVYI